MAKTVSLIVRRTIRALPERVFAAWTEASQVAKWWGPRNVRCAGAEIDLRAGGRYRIGNELPDGKLLWICGEFERVTPPRELVYTWRIEPGPETSERVTVRFEPREAATEVIVIHERIGDEATRAGHEAGWEGCLDGLVEHLAGTRGGDGAEA
jgi:uncharacterized protein YndB with AHSA1/START domain